MQRRRSLQETVLCLARTFRTGPNIIANNRVVFNIKGNDYRLIVAIAYRMQYVYVKFIGTHAEYDKVDAAVVDQFKGV